MGLLDDLIGQLAGGSARQPSAPGPQGRGGPGMSTTSFPDCSMTKPGAVPDNVLIIVPTATETIPSIRLTRRALGYGVFPSCSTY